jgi:hypothetical protein
MSFNGFDENYKLLEDYPLLIKYTQNNYKIWLIRKSLVAYRLHGNNISFESSLLLLDSSTKFRNEILFPLLIRHKLYLTFWHRYLVSKQQQENNFITMFLMGLSPIGWILKIYKIFGKSYFYNHKLEFQKKSLLK